MKSFNFWKKTRAIRSGRSLAFWWINRFSVIYFHFGLHVNVMKRSGLPNSLTIAIASWYCWAMNRVNCRRCLEGSHFVQCWLKNRCSDWWHLPNLGTLVLWVRFDVSLYKLGDFARSWHSHPQRIEERVGHRDEVCSYLVYNVDESSKSPIAWYFPPYSWFASFQWPNQIHRLGIRAHSWRDHKLCGFHLFFEGDRLLL